VAVEEVELADLVDDAVVVSVTPQDAAATDPFGNSKQFHVEKVVNLAQLQSEIEEATGATLAISLQRVPGEEKGILFISPGEAVDGRTVNGKIKSHDPDPLFGMTDDQKMTAQVMEKIRAGESLSPKELTLALQSLAERR
jgi:hypothetical protein